MYIRRIFSVAAAVLSIGICVFITYISRDVDLQTVLFNLGFLAVMLIMIVVSYLVGLRRLIGDCHSLNQASSMLRDGAPASIESSEGNFPLFQNSFLDSCYQQYCRMQKNNPEASCDIKNFINEEVIEEHAHRGLLEMVPDILTSLGILGTFVGLVMGLQSFDPSGYEQMAGSVTPLINGIKVAFITSIYGISLSLSFSFNLRSEFANLTSSIEEFLDTYYLNVRPPYEVDSLSKLIGSHKSQDEMRQELTEIFVEQMGKSFNQAITPAFDRMTDGLSRVVNAFTENQQRVMSEICQTVIGEMRSELTQDFDQIRQTVAELEKSHSGYTDFMDRSMTRLSHTFSAMQQSMEQMAQYNTDALERLTDAQHDAYRITQEQKATYQEYIRFMYQSIEKFSAVWEANNERMQAYSDEISRLGPIQSNREMLRCLDVIAGQLDEIKKRQLFAERASEMSDSDRALSEMLDQTLQKLDNLEELVSTPALFRSRRRKPTKGKEI